MKKEIKILAIETSCDETAAAVVAFDNKSMQITPLSSVVFSQIDIHKKYGGVFPELASRSHTQKIKPVVAEALASAQVSSDKLPVTGKNSPITNIDAIAVTTGPGLIGSLIVGVEFTRGLAASLGVPVIPINHLEGHIYANFVSSSSNVKCQMSNPKQVSKSEIQNSKLPSFPLLALIVSGGHTMLVLMRSHLDYDIIGTTLDDAAGEAFDKIARMLGLPYPGGPALSSLAEKGDAKSYKFPRSMLDSGDYSFSFSGLKTSVFYKLRDLGLVDDKAEPAKSAQATNDKPPITNHQSLTTKSDIAAAAQQAIVDVLVKKTLKACKEYSVKSLVIGGGVSANKLLRETFLSSPVIASEARQSGLKIYLSPLDLTGDNALSIAAAACYRYQNGDTCSWKDLEANASLKLVNS